MTAANPVPDPGETVLQHHLTTPEAVDAVSRGWMRIDDLTWPTLTATITSATGSLTLRLDLAEYPRQAPAGQPWDLTADQPLGMHRWPTGTRASEVFSHSWSPSNGNALYMPLDRKAQAGHESWAGEHPGYWWNANKTVLDYLRLVRDIIRGATLPEAAA